MASSVLRLPQISLLLLIILKTSVVLSSRSGLPVILNTYDGGLEPKRFLQNNRNNNNNNQNTCQASFECRSLATAGTPYTMVLQNNSALLYILDLSQQTSDTALTFSYNSTSTSSGIITEMALLPFFGQELDITTPSNYSFSLVISQELIQEYENADGSLEFLVINYSGATTTVTVEMTFAAGSSSTSDSGISLIDIILPIAGGLFLIMLLGVCCHYRRKRLERERRQRSMEARRVRGAARRARNGEAQQEDEEEDEEEEELEDPLTEGNIKERFPEAEFEQFKSSFPQTTCSVCLEEFQKRVACRQLYCEHMFHSECIRLWLANQLKKGHAFCPNCNKDMMHKPLEVEGEVPHAEVQEQVQAQAIPGH